MKGIFLRKSIIICSMLIFSSSVALRASANSTDDFMSVSDIHFNPLADCPLLSAKACPLAVKLQTRDAAQWKKIFEESASKSFVSYYHDTNYALLKSSLAEVNQVYTQAHPKFVLLLGDMLAHHYQTQYMLFTHDRSAEGYKKFVKKTFQFLTQEIRVAIPEGDIYPAVGNNDSYTGNYTVVGNGAFLQDVSNIWSTLIKDESNRNSFQKTFPLAGYYEVSVPSDRSKHIIMLDTVLFSGHATGNNMKNLANLQLQWLQQRLHAANEKKQSVILAYHIPVGIDVYASLKAFGNIRNFWKPEYNETFSKILHAEYGTIKAILPGHIHMDSFQFFTVENMEQIPVSFTPSISPIYGNNPGFKVYQYDPNTFQLKNFSTYSVSLMNPDNGWSVEYNFNKIYQGNCSDCTLKKGMEALIEKKNYISSYQKYFTVGSAFQPMKTAKDWKSYYCGMTNTVIEKYEACLH